jgi:hypothetical protein
LDKVPVVLIHLVKSDGAVEFLAGDGSGGIVVTATISDLLKWGGTSLTGRDISLDLKALTDDSVKGILKTLGDIASAENLINRIGLTSDAIVAAGATGSLAAKLRRVTQGLEDLKTLIILAASTNVIGKVRLVTAVGDEITDDTLDAIKNTEKFGGAIYVNSNTATDDSARRFETSSKKLRDVIILVESNGQLFGDDSSQVYPVDPDETIGFTRVDISTLNFKNASAGANGTVYILGVEE